jgi:hypothetical protein
VDKLAAEFERAEARAEAREAAERARPRRSHPNVPPDAARTIERARAAIATRDFRALETLLDDYDGIGSFELTRDLTATTARAAIDGWRKNPAILQRTDEHSRQTARSIRPTLRTGPLRCDVRHPVEPGGR